jgi:GDP-L-fucose synthase
MKILITGSTGMVGRNIIESNYFNNCTILKPKRKELDLSNMKAVRHYFEDNNPKMVIHCAGVVGGIQANIKNQVKYLSANTRIGLNVIMGAYEAGVNKFMNISSSCMYPRNALNPLAEESILNGELEPTNEGYAIAKITSTRLCEYITKQNSNFYYKTIIPCNLYGKYDKFDSQFSHMIPAVIKKIHEAKEHNLSEINIWGDGNARREFMYVDDLCDFIFYAKENFESVPQNINVGLGHDFSINEYYRAIASVIGYDGDFTYDLNKPIGMKQKLIDDTKLKKFGWRYKTHLQDGLRKTYNYYLMSVLNGK